MQNHPGARGVIFMPSLFMDERTYCAMYVCHLAGTTSTATFLRRLVDTTLIAIGMCFVLLCTSAASRASTFIAHFMISSDMLRRETHQP